MPICLDICDLYLVNFPICCSIPTLDPQLALDLAVGGDLGGGDEQEEQQAGGGDGAREEGEPSLQVFNLFSLNNILLLSQVSGPTNKKSIAELMT